MQRYVAWRARRIGERGPRRAVWRAGVALVGALLVVGGIALVPLPGPGWVIVFVGLGVLATEFAWAEHLLRRLRGLVDTWTVWVRAQSFAVRTGLGAGCLVAVVAALVGLTYVIGTPSWVPDGLPLVR
jgi:uncharacterized protein (TIGR02611 family)